MSGHLATLGLIPARGGSKGIRRKNVRPFLGIPLVERAIRIGLQACDRVCCSTDDADIGLIATQSGAQVIWRPPRFATDQAAMYPVVLHALEELQGEPPQIVVLLQPTSPLRTVAQVTQAIRMLEETGADSVVSVVPLPMHLSPDYVMRINRADKLVDFLPGTRPERRQDCRRAYYRDGTVYVSRLRTISSGSLYGSDCRALVLAPDESATLDSEADWQHAEMRAGGPPKWLSN